MKKSLAPEVGSYTGRRALAGIFGLLTIGSRFQLLQLERDCCSVQDLVHRTHCLIGFQFLLLAMQGLDQLVAAQPPHSKHVQTSFAAHNSSPSFTRSMDFSDVVAESLTGMPNEKALVPN